MSELAPADSLLGQLQRGRGAGFLWALREDPASLHPLLMACVIADPRWDRQIETRSDYYASLIIYAGLPLDAFEAHLRALNETDSDLFGYLLTLQTVCSLAICGHAGAAALLRDYVGYGEYWDMAAEALANAPDTPIDLPELDRIIGERFPDDAALDDELPILPGDREPWRSWRALNPRFERIFAGHERAAAQRKQQEEQLRARCATLSAAELLAMVDAHNDHIVASTLRDKASAADVGLLLDTFERARPLLYAVERAGDRSQESISALMQARVALRGLDRLAPPAAFPVLRAFFESADEPARSAASAAMDTMVALPPDITLDLARAWFGAPNRRHRTIARLILEEHAPIDDVPRVREALIAALQRDTPHSSECYAICGFLEILTRFSGAGPYPESETAFEQAGYSWVRRFAAEALDASEPERFARGLALECLWDCDERVRLIGCESVDLALPAARERLHALWHDPHEDDDVRREAGARLAATHPHD